MSRAIRDHIVPKFFLIRFADAHPRLLVCDLKEDREFEANPKKIGFELDYCTVETASGPSDAIEQALGKLESETARALREIDAGTSPPTDAARGAIASFMALQFVRGQDFRDMGDRAATEMARMRGIDRGRPSGVRTSSPRQGGGPRGYGRGGGCSDRRPSQRGGHGRGHARAATQDDAHGRGRGGALLLQAEVVPRPGEDFPTTDMPVVLWQRELRGFFGQGVDVGTADEIAMAISPTRALMLVHHDEITGGKSGAERVVDRCDYFERRRSALQRRSTREP